MARTTEAKSRPETITFGDRLADAVDAKRSQLVVGLDPRPELLPVELRGDTHVGRASAAAACARFCCGLVDAVAPYVVGVKPQLAFFESLGSDGIRAFEEVCAYGRNAGLLVIGRGLELARREPDRFARLALLSVGKRPLLSREDLERRRIRHPGSPALRRIARLAAGRRTRRRLGV